MDARRRTRVPPHDPSATTTRLRPPRNTYWRGDVLWAKFKVRGRLVRASLRTGSPKLAEKRLKLLRDQLENEMVYGAAAPVSWMEAVIAWRAAAPDSSTTRRYATSLVQLRAHLDGLDVQQVNADVLRAIVRDRRRFVSVATVNRDLTAISAVLDHAVGEGWIADNAAYLFDRSRLRETRDPIDLPEPARIRRAIAACADAFAQGAEFALETGMRQEEVFSLTWAQVDRGRRAVSLTRTKRRRVREVPLSPRAMAIIEARPVYLGSPHVFWHGEGERYAAPASSWRDFLDRLAERDRKEIGRDIAAAGQGGTKGGTASPPAREAFEPFPFHHLRHRFAVDFLRSRRGTIYDLQRILGHGSLTTTEGYLDYLTPDERRAATQEGAQNEAQVQRSDRRKHRSKA
ncbi:MAG: tyrosine-type recombinase/integrase [Alphaproteobacteria bacterium]|nr:tyrosine-type recombinase/integrase [Alphaproteobacteria bacterium]